MMFRVMTIRMNITARITKYIVSRLVSKNMASSGKGTLDTPVGPPVNSLGRAYMVDMTVARPRVTISRPIPLTRRDTKPTTTPATTPTTATMARMSTKGTM